MLTCPHLAPQQQKGYDLPEMNGGQPDNKFENLITRIDKNGDEAKGVGSSSASALAQASEYSSGARYDAGHEESKLKSAPRDMGIA